MGKAIERIAKERGHEIVSVIDMNNQEDFNSDAFRSADVAIEFTVPQKAVENYRKSFAAGVPVVSGTTGWNDKLPEIKAEVEKNNYALFWSSNFSLGMNIFMAVNKYLASVMNDFPEYDMEITETHHIHKLDAPSGTAITLAEDILSNISRKNAWVKEEEEKSDELAIKSIREGEVPGIHTIHYESAVDSISITHDAKSRDGLAYGAVVAAEFLKGKKGFLGMSDLFNFTPKK